MPLNAPAAAVTVKCLTALRQGFGGWLARPQVTAHSSKDCSSKETLINRWKHASVMSISLQATLVQHLYAAYILYNRIDIAVCASVSFCSSKVMSS